MKRCPECNSFFPDAEHFCEFDGTLLVTVDDAPANPLPVERTGVVPQPKSNLGLLPIGVLMGIILGGLLVLVYFAMSRQKVQENSDISSSSSSSRQQESFPPQRPRASASPSVEPSVEPSPSPTETPSPQSSPQIELSSSNPISTAPGAKGSGPVIIKLVSGLTIEADEAWQTGEGIWYRKHGVVSLLNPNNVKAVEKVSAASQPSPTSSPSP